MIAYISSAFKKDVSKAVDGQPFTALVPIYGKVIIEFAFSSFIPILLTKNGKI